MLIQVKVLRVNLEDRDSLEWTGLLQTLVPSIMQKLGIRSRPQVVNWWMMVRHISTTPRHAFTCWLAPRNRLTTHARLKFLVSRCHLAYISQRV